MLDVVPPYFLISSLKRSWLASMCGFTLDLSASFLQMMYVQMMPGWPCGRGAIRPGSWQARDGWRTGCRQRGGRRAHRRASHAGARGSEDGILLLHDGRCRPQARWSRGCARRQGGARAACRCSESLGQPASERVGVGRLISRHVDIVCNGKCARFINIRTYAISEVVEAS